MRRTCILCNQEYEVANEPKADEKDNSSALCNLCAEDMKDAKKFTLADYLDTLPVPVFSVNEEGIIDLANKRATQYFDKDVQHMKGARGGDIFACANACLPGGCGRTINCGACTLRRAVMKTYETGETIYRQAAYLKRIKNGGELDSNFFVTTIKYNQYVILRIEGLES